MSPFVLILRRLIGLLFVALGVSLAGLGLWVAQQYAPHWFAPGNSTDRDIAGVVVGAFCLVLGVLIALVGLHLLLRTPTKMALAAGKAAGPRCQRVYVSAAVSTVLWPLLVCALFLMHSQGGVAALLWPTLALGLGVYLGVQALVLCHELGHLGVAALLGMELHRLRIGIGPRLFSVRGPGGLRFDWYVLLGGGAVYATDSQECGWRWRHWLFVAGGPAAHAAALAALVWWLHPPGGRGWLARASQGEAAALLALGLLYVGSTMWLRAMWPATSSIGATRLHTDGYWLVRTPRLNPDFVRQQAIAADMISAESLWNRGRREAAWARVREAQARYPGDSGHALADGVLLGWEGRHAEAAESFRQRLEGAPVPEPLRVRLCVECLLALVRAGDPDSARRSCELALRKTAPPDRAEMLDGLATAALAPEGRAFLPEADLWSQEMVALEPDAVTRAGTRAAVLTELGRLEEAEPMLRCVWAESPKDMDAVMSAFCLGVIAGKRGRRREQRRWRRQVRRFAAVAPKWVVERNERPEQPGDPVGIEPAPPSSRDIEVLPF